MRKVWFVLVNGLAIIGCASFAAWAETPQDELHRLNLEGKNLTLIKTSYDALTLKGITHFYWSTYLVTPDATATFLTRLKQIGVPVTPYPPHYQLKQNEAHLDLNSQGGHVPILQLFVWQQCYLARNPHRTFSSSTYHDTAVADSESEQSSAVEEITSLFIINFLKANATAK